MIWLKRVSPCLTLIKWFQALHKSCMLSHATYRYEVFPRLEQVTCFPALGLLHASLQFPIDFYLIRVSDMGSLQTKNCKRKPTYFLFLGRFLALFALFLDLGLALRRAGTWLSWLCSFLFRRAQHSTHPPVPHVYKQTVKREKKW